ncbi:MAG TPA: hypothetical protein VGW10_16085 [Solirubrobacteraceae bacterium]|nr:hypothetical protein [Solirubrobacteraceae bacterium]
MGISEVKVAITTTSQQQKTPGSTGAPPKITMNGNPFPTPQGPPSGPWPNFSSGLQVVVIDPTLDITKPAAIRSNKYWPLPNRDGDWMSYYHAMWDHMASQIYTSGNTSQQIVFVATFGMDVNAAPAAEELELLILLGGGPQLQKWWTSVDVGSQSGQWVARPGNYILVGQPQYSYGSAPEVYQTGNPVSTTLNATLTNYAGA